MIVCTRGASSAFQEKYGVDVRLAWASYGEVSVGNMGSEASFSLHRNRRQCEPGFAP